LIAGIAIGTYGSAYAQTPGYWKNHALAGSAQYDATWEVVGGPDMEFFSTGRTWLEELNTPPQGSPFHILAHQYIAAYLNTSRENFEQLRLAGAPGLSTQDITGMLATAGDMLQGYKLNSMIGTDGTVAHQRADREDYISLAGSLDAFNNIIAEQRELLEESAGSNPVFPSRTPTTWGQLKTGFGNGSR